MPTFANGDGSFFNEANGSPLYIINSGTAVSVTHTMAWSERDVLINNTSTLTTTVVLNLPKVESGHKVEVGSIANLGTLTLHDVFGNAISGAPTALTAGTSVIMRYVNSTLGWKRWR